MCLVCLVFLPFLVIYIYISDLLYKIIIGAFYGTIFGSLFINLLFSIQKCARAIHVVHAELYSLLDRY